MPTLQELIDTRKKKLHGLSDQKINPYGSHNLKKMSVSVAKDMLDKDVKVAGRIFGIRGHGKMIFADIKDETGKIQLVFKVDVLKPEEFALIPLLDVGDFIYAEGKVFKTIQGEVSVQVVHLRFLTKSIRPLPDKWHGLKDVEDRYRQRYVDLLINEDARRIFTMRSKIVTYLRHYLDTNGFTEVETPVLQPLYGGATAKPFTTHQNALDIDLYLRISDELYLKRLIVGGFDRVYEIGKDFRNEGIDHAHNPEFTMLEFYWAYADYQELMRFSEDMLSSLVKEVTGSYEVEFNDQKYNFKAPWERKTYRQLFQEYVGIDIDEVNDEKKLRSALKEKNIQVNDKGIVGYAALLDASYKKAIRPKLVGPLFVTDHPIELKPLAKRSEKDPGKAASFQLLVGGEELINAYNELNDPEDQKNRWIDEMNLAKEGLEEYQMLDADYIRALEYGMPPTAGWGLGIDRLTSFLTNQHSLKEVILFPTLRPEDTHETKI